LTEIKRRLVIKMRLPNWKDLLKPKETAMHYCSMMGRVKPIQPKEMPMGIARHLGLGTQRMNCLD
jgi:hypothetical protein